MHEVLALEVEFVFFIPIPPDGQNFVGALLNRNHVRQGDARHLALLISVLKPLEVQVHVHLQQPEPVIVQRRQTHLFGLLFLNIVQLVRWLADVYVHVEPSLHELGHFILGLTHNVRNPLRAFKA